MAYKVWWDIVCGLGLRLLILANSLILRQTGILWELRCLLVEQWMGARWSLANANSSRLMRIEFANPPGND